MTLNCRCTVKHHPFFLSSVGRASALKAEGSGFKSIGCLLPDHLGDIWCIYWMMNLLPETKEVCQNCACPNDIHLSQFACTPVHVYIVLVCHLTPLCVPQVRNECIITCVLLSSVICVVAKPVASRGKRMVSNLLIFVILCHWWYTYSFAGSWN